MPQSNDERIPAKQKIQYDCEIPRQYLQLSDICTDAATIIVCFDSSSWLISNGGVICVHADCDCFPRRLTRPREGGNSFIDSLGWRHCLALLLSRVLKGNAYGDSSGGASANRSALMKSIAGNRLWEPIQPQATLTSRGPLSSVAIMSCNSVSQIDWVA